ncbi:hypothetical protein CLV42_10888 [Chitinophaga ginsengisoli]|uniref:Uncharacterized protein n=1 Tax=Chitinophaga ginsengisoli TaxID=363837 RepID=A0A2P8G2G6_9BACT|nr:hypothetical protein CLV42_10888 [Chitinophaga ginsengisoli]
MNDGVIPKLSNGQMLYNSGANSITFNEVKMRLCGEVI